MGVCAATWFTSFMNIWAFILKRKPPDIYDNYLIWRYLIKYVILVDSTIESRLV